MRDRKTYRKPLRGNHVSDEFLFAWLTPDIPNTSFKIYFLNTERKISNDILNILNILNIKLQEHLGYEILPKGWLGDTMDGELFAELKWGRRRSVGVRQVENTTIPGISLSNCLGLHGYTATRVSFNMSNVR